MTRNPHSDHLFRLDSFFRLISPSGLGRVQAKLPSPNSINSFVFGNFLPPWGKFVFPPLCCYFTAACIWFENSDQTETWHFSLNQKIDTDRMMTGKWSSVTGQRLSLTRTDGGRWQNAIIAGCKMNLTHLINTDNHQSESLISVGFLRDVWWLLNKAEAFLTSHGWFLTHQWHSTFKLLTMTTTVTVTVTVYLVKYTGLVLDLADW